MRLGHLAITHMSPHLFTKRIIKLTYFVNFCLRSLFYLIILKCTKNKITRSRIWNVFFLYYNLNEVTLWKYFWKCRLLPAISNWIGGNNYKTTWVWVCLPLQLSVHCSSLEIICGSKNLKAIGYSYWWVQFCFIVLTSTAYLFTMC